MPITLQASQTRRALLGLLCAAVVVSAIPEAYSQAPTQSSRPNLNGVWNFEGPPWVSFQNISLTPEYQAIAKQPGSPPGACASPVRFPAMMVANGPIQFIDTPEKVIAIAAGSVRRIYTDGRANNPNGKRSNVGYSVGRWEGRTFVVETTGLPTTGIIGQSQFGAGPVGFPHSDQVRITERIVMTSDNQIEYNISIEDSKALTRPATIMRKYNRLNEVSGSEMAGCQIRVTESFKF